MPDFYAMNTTQSSVAGSMSLGGMIWLVIMIAIIVGFIVLLTSLERYSKFWAALEWILHSVKFTLYGAGISGALYGIYLACEMIVSAGSGFDPIYIAYGIGGYVALTILGWVASKTYTRMKDMHNQYKIKKNGEMPL